MTSRDEPPRIADRMRSAATRSFVGREQELERLERLLVDDKSAVVFVHGIGGIGKSALLRALEPRLSARGLVVLRTNAQDIEPTPQGVLAALAAALGSSATTLSELGRALFETGHSGVVWLVDEYDGLRLVDTWMRQSLLPSLPSKASVVFAGQSRPVAAWTSALEWDGLVSTLELGPLTAAEAEQMLLSESVPAGSVAELRRVTGDHPLALRLAAAAVAARPALPLAELGSRLAAGELAERLLGAVEDPELVRAVEAASLVRRVTRPLLAALLGSPEQVPAFGALSRLPFVEISSDGLSVHETVRRALSARLAALDPAQHRRLRRQAWRVLEPEIRAMRPSSSWRATADALYLVEQPAVRDAFFPSDRNQHAVEQARPGDRGFVLDAAHARLGPNEAAVLARWWEALPGSFHVVRDGESRVLAFYVLAFANQVPDAVRDADPVVARWISDAAGRFPDPQRPVLLNRVTISAATGERQSPERASAYLDIKRWYLENPRLCALYASAHDPDELPLLEKLRFRALAELDFEEGPFREVRSILLDFGSGVGEWLSRLLELESRDPEQPNAELDLDRKTRELLVAGERRKLTRLEYGVLDHLLQYSGSVATRDELLAAVWGQTHTGSNVVDVVIRSLRKKLGAQAARLETVTGFGYKLVL